MYKTLVVKGNEYQLRLTSGQSIELEKKLGMSLFKVVNSMSEISMETIINILYYSMRAIQHDITFDKVLNIYDDMVEEGKLLEDIMDILLEVFEISGFFKAEKETKETKKKKE